MGGLKKAEELDLLPYIQFGPGDVGKFRAFPSSVSWSWQDFFTQPELPKGAEEGDLRVLGGLMHPWPNIFDVEPNELREIFERHCSLKSAHKETILNNSPGQFSIPTLGVHFRAGDMRWYALHPTPPSEGHMIRAIKRELSTGDYKQVFIASESRQFIKKAERALSDQVAVVSGYSGDLNRAIDSGHSPILRVIADAHYLGSCKTVIHSRSNVAWAAFVFNSGSLEKSLELDLGTNPSFAPWSIIRSFAFFHIVALFKERKAKVITRIL